MDKDERESPKKTNPAQSSTMTNSSSTKAFLKFKRNVEKKIEDAILERMKAFREEILKSRLR
jgi:hypothetical protein